MRKIVTLAALLITGIAFQARAQFFTPGEDPGYLRWYSIETPYYQVIYPEGKDSLAREYGRLLEQFRVPLGRSIGFIPGVRQRNKMPVVLHAFHPYPNGAMGWAPTRYDLYTLPDPYGSDPVPWQLQLAAHEPRHQAQMERSGQKGVGKVFSLLLGEAWAPVGWVLYLGRPFGEGDAVAGETGMIRGTRARTADFLNYYRIAFDQGDWRNWERWRYGSFRHYSPDVYTVGYMTVAGSRYLYQNPYVVRDEFKVAEKNPLMVTPFSLWKATRPYSGRQKKPFQPIMEAFQEVWEADYAVRAPFLELTPVTEKERFPVDYLSPVVSGGELYAVRKGYVRAPELVKIVPGEKPQHVLSFASHHSALAAGPDGRIWWSETRPNPRWALSGTSVIRCFDPLTHKTKDLTAGTLFYNPHPTPDGKSIVVSENRTDGSTAVVVLDAASGAVLQRFRAPDGVQATEALWLDGSVYALGLSMDGYGLYRIGAQDVWDVLLPPAKQKVRHLTYWEGGIAWVSDRTGVNELYTYQPSGGILLQQTTLRYGAQAFAAFGDRLYCSSGTLDGHLLFSLPKEALQPKEVPYNETHTYPIEDVLTRQERALGPAPEVNAPVPMGAPQRYRKLGHPMRLHSWAPLYLNVDEVKNGSFDFSYETASIGAMAFFQNTLGSFSGYLGYSLHPDPDISSHWRNALHAKFTYTGLYPVLEASFHLEDEAARQYLQFNMLDKGVAERSLNSRRTDVPSMSGVVRAYLPLSFRKGGLLWGVTPQVSYAVSNSLIGLNATLLQAPDRFEKLPSHYILVQPAGPEKAYMQRLTASVRGYLMKPRAVSQIYPRAGIGLEAGASLRPGSTPLFSPNIYAYAYGYLPGITRSQGLMLTGMFQHQLQPGTPFHEMSVSVLPRGFSSLAAANLASSFPTQWRLTADYAIPLYFGDISIPLLAYIKNFILTPHADYMRVDADAGKQLWSAGADLAAHLERIFFAELDATLGVSFSWLGGSLYSTTEQEKPYSVSLIFKTEF
ncbi:MAG: hypothetical protein K6G53_02325 [Bacteroidales bacterium]|nr:hypothetical protein [Bacteroidales bacterium]